MIEPIKQKYEKSGPKVVEALKKRHFDAYYVSTKEEAEAMEEKEKSKAKTSSKSSKWNTFSKLSLLRTNFSSL